jgi:hypothetical protein
MPPIRHAKILTEIIGPTETKKRRLEIDASGGKPKIIVKQGGLGRGDTKETAEFDKTCIVTYSKGLFMFKRPAQKLILKEGANKCVSFGDVASTEAPSCSKEDVNRLGKATVIRFAGHSDKPESRLGLYLLMIIIIALVAVSIGVSSGHIRI